MAGINFVILKINGIDVTSIPHEEAVQIFLKAPEPILVEVRRRLTDNQQKQNSLRKPTAPNHEFVENSTSLSRDHEEDIDDDNDSDLKVSVSTESNSDSIEKTATTTTSIGSTETTLKLKRTLEKDNSLESLNTINSIPCNTSITHIQQQQKQKLISLDTITSKHHIVDDNFEENVRITTSTINNDHCNRIHQNTTVSLPTTCNSSAAINTNISNNNSRDKCYVSTAVQTDMFTSEFIFNNSSMVDNQTNEDNLFEDYNMTPEIDIEEVTLRKSISNERLGLTVKCSSGNASGSDDTDTCTEVYISDIMPNSIAARDGRLREGDQILQVNGRDVLNKEDTESLIAENKNAVTLLVSRYLFTDDDLKESGEYYKDDQQITYENYSVEQQCFIDNCSLTNVSSPEHKNASSTESSISPKHISINVEKPLKLSSTSSSSSQYQQQKFEQSIPSSTIDTVLSTANPLHHANIKAHLESVNNEIAMLNTRVENMMFHKKSQNDYLTGNHNLNSSIYRIPVDNTVLTTTTMPMTSSSSSAGGVNENNLSNNYGNAAVTTIDDDKSLSSSSLRYLSRNRVIDSDTEHIYETIPENSESESLYCSPYEPSNQNLVENWLETQENGILPRFDRKLVQQVAKIKQQQNSNNMQQKTSTKSNSSGDDRENSSSAYNTGGSCNSNNQLTFELISNDDPRDKDVLRSTLTLCPSLQRLDNKANESCKQCQREKKEKNIHRKIPLSVPLHNFQQQQQQQICAPHSVQNVIQKSHANDQIIKSNYSTLKANEETFRSEKQKISNTGLIPTETMYTNKANLQQTMLLQQKLFRQALLQQNQPTIRTRFTAPNLNQYYFVSGQEVATVTSKSTENDIKMEWKVKRRQDGSRYIVRRPTRNKVLRDRAMKINEERNECTTEDDTISEIKTGRYWTREERKKHIGRARERRHRQQLIILNENSDNIPNPQSPQHNVGCVSSLPPSSSMALNKITAIKIQDHQQQQLQSQYLSQQTKGELLRHNSTTRTTTTSYAVDPLTAIHKKVAFKKKSNKDELTEAKKQISGNGGNNSNNNGGDNGNKATEFLSVTTV